jgi:hypothetical protein
MSQHLPIACTLDAADFPARERRIAELGRDALLDADRDGAHAVLRFAAGGAVTARVERFVADESRCCPFLEMRVQAAGDEVVLTIDTPADGELALAELVAAFGAR